MTLENLRRIGMLKPHEPDAKEIRRLLDAARRNLSDAGVADVSDETRFDAAYKAILQVGLVALMARGFRPDTNRPGHHMTILQSLPATLGIPGGRVAVLDTFRRRRQLADYLGEGIDHATLRACVDEASRIVHEVERWIARTRPELSG